MRKGLEHFNSGSRQTTAAGKYWRIDLFFPAILVGIAYLLARSFGL